MKCLVTGAAGFIGSSLCDELLRQGHSVVGIDCFVDYYPREIKLRNLAAAKRQAGFAFLEQDLRECNLEELLGQVEVVFHQAAQAGVRASWGSSFEPYCQHNILATQRLLEHAKSQRHLKKIVYASSSSVYGDAETFPTPEDVVPRPVSPYGVTKLAAENLMRLYATEFDVPTVSLRYFTVYGPRQRPDMAFHRFARAALQKKELTVYGTGEQRRDFTYVGDIVAANMLACERGQPGQVFNIGGGTQASINQVLSIIEGIAGSLRVVRTGREKGDAMHTSADTAAARTLLGFTPQVDLAEGIRREMAWMEQELTQAH